VPGYPLCRKAVWASAASVCLLACACMGSTLPGPAGPSTDVPIELALPTITGPPLDVAALRGQVLLIDVMATWSLDSQAQVPLFSKLLAAYRERGLRVVSVAFDSQTPQLVRTWVDTLGVSWPVGLASPEVIEGRSPLGVIPEIPRTLILDRKGYVRFAHSGAVPAALLAKEIEALL